MFTCFPAVGGAHAGHSVCDVCRLLHSDAKLAAVRRLPPTRSTSKHAMIREYNVNTIDCRGGPRETPTLYREEEKRR